MEVSDPPLVSVIVCTYNRPNELKRALHSIWEQDFKNFELIVVDDGSNEPAEIPEYWHTQATLLRIGHKGIGTARGTGLDAVKGVFVAYCDDDDEWKPNHLSCLLSYLLENPEVDLVYGDSEWVQNGVKYTSIPYSVDYAIATLRYWNYIFASDVLHRTRAAREVGGFDNSLQAFEDWDLWLRMTRFYTILHLLITLGVRYWQRQCVSTGDYWQDNLQVYQANENRLKETGEAAQHGLFLEQGQTIPFDHSTWSPARKELMWQSILRADVGYGTVGRQLILALERQGVDIAMAPTKDQPPKGFERFYKSQKNQGRIGFYYDGSLKPGVLNCERIISYSM